MSVGILALQGDFEAHGRKLSRRGIAWQAVRNADEIASVHGLILPGGESTTIWILMENHGIDQAIREAAQRGVPVLATCSGSILLSRQIRNSDRKGLGILDAEIIRNAYGRQIKSSIALLDKTRKDIFGAEPLEAVFIRAPRFAAVGDSCDILAWYNNDPVFIRCGNVMALTFHPELSDDDRILNLFIEAIDVFRQSRIEKNSLSA